MVKKFSDQTWYALLALNMEYCQKCYEAIEMYVYTEVHITDNCNTMYALIYIQYILLAFRLSGF